MTYTYYENMRNLSEDLANAAKKAFGQEQQMRKTENDPAGIPLKRFDIQRWFASPKTIDQARAMIDMVFMMARLSGLYVHQDDLVAWLNLEGSEFGNDYRNIHGMEYEDIENLMFQQEVDSWDGIEDKPIRWMVI